MTIDELSRRSCSSICSPGHRLNDPPLFHTVIPHGQSPKRWSHIDASSYQFADRAPLSAAIKSPRLSTALHPLYHPPLTSYRPFKFSNTKPTLHKYLELNPPTHHPTTKLSKPHQRCILPTFLRSLPLSLFPLWLCQILNPRTALEKRLRRLGLKSASRMGT